MRRSERACGKQTWACSEKTRCFRGRPEGVATLAAPKASKQVQQIHPESQVTEWTTRKWNRQTPRSQKSQKQHVLVILTMALFSQRRGGGRKEGYINPAIQWLNVVMTSVQYLPVAALTACVVNLLVRATNKPQLPTQPINGAPGGSTRGGPGGAGGGGEHASKAKRWLITGSPYLPLPSL